MTAPLLKSDINLFLTGGSSNTNPNLSIGGNVSSTQVINDTLHNLIRRITESELSSGVTIYRCVAIKNTNSTETAKNVVFYLVVDTTSTDDLTLYSKAVAAKNTAESAIADEFTTPSGTNFITSLTRSGGLALGDLAAGEYINVWIRISVNPGASPLAENTFRYRIEVNPTTDSGTPGPNPTPDPDTGISWNFAVIGDCGCNSNFDANWSKIKARNPRFVWFNGDDAYSSGSTCFTGKVGSTWKPKSCTSFGNHDVDESESQPSTKNELLNFFSLTNTYHKKVINNAGFVIMESGENQSVSDSVGSAQYNFVKAALEEFKANSAIEWIIVLNHYPLYGPNSNHSNNGGGRDRYDPLFDTNGVDAVFTSHNHNVWNSRLLKYNSGSPSNPTASGTDPNYSYNRATENHGKLYIGSGGGGRSHYSASAASYTPFLNDSNYGYWFMEISGSGKVLTFKCYTNNDELLKTVTLTHT